MNGYKTGGDWTDVTSISRNEVVFEGRHKAYGAFYIRQRYQNALLVALLSAIGFIGLCGFMAYLFRNTTHIIKAPDTHVTIDPSVIIIPPATHPTIKPPPSIRPPKLPKGTSANTIPVGTAQIDTTSDKKPEVFHVVSSGPSGPGNAVIDINPPEGGGIIDKGEAPPIDNKPRMWVSEMPKFPGGDIKDYLGKKIRYPAEESQTGVQGTVYASFVIERDGSVSNVTIARGISNGSGLNKEAVRVLSEMPKWTPGKQDGHPVRVQYMVPIHFKLQ